MTKLSDLYDLKRSAEVSARRLNAAIRRLESLQRQLDLPAVLPPIVEAVVFDSEEDRRLRSEEARLTAEIRKVKKIGRKAYDHVDTHDWVLSALSIAKRPWVVPAVCVVELAIVAGVCLLTLATYPVPIRVAAFMVTGFVAVFATLATAPVRIRLLARWTERTVQGRDGMLGPAEEAPRVLAGLRADLEKVRGELVVLQEHRERLARHELVVRDLRSAERELDGAGADYARLRRRFEQAYEEYQATVVPAYVEEMLPEIVPAQPRIVVPVDPLVARRRRLKNCGWRDLQDDDFELFVCDVFDLLGYHVEKVGGYWDQGVDVVATKGTEKIAIQCKGLSGYANNFAIQQAYAGMTYYGCTKCVAIVTTWFSRHAQNLARTTGCILIEGHAIPSLIDGEFEPLRTTALSLNSEPIPW
jgi:HJR/Mrr/RecB family endonuclease